MKLAAPLSRLLLAAVFFYAGVVKLGTSEQFAVTIAQFYILPKSWIGVFAGGLPWLEIVVGILLLVPRTSRAGAFAAAVLLVIFIAALTWGWSQGFTFGCGCFGDGEDEPVSAHQIPYAIARDVALLALTLLLAARRPAARRPH